MDHLQPLASSTATASGQMVVTSAAFSESAMLPAKYTCDGADLNPPLALEGLPAGTRSLSIIMTGTYDGKQEWTHWLAWNIPPVTHIAEGRKMESEGLNYFSRRGYEGPCPSGGLHLYTFAVYALDTRLALPSTTIKAELEQAMTGHVLAMGTLSCFYQRTHG